MKMLTIRIYFEHGARAFELTPWQRFWNNSLAHQLIKTGKHNDLKQMLLFNISAGYLNNQLIEWGMSEHISHRHPQCLEITDQEDKIEHFLVLMERHLKAASIIAVESQTIRQIKK